MNLRTAAAFTAFAIPTLAAIAFLYLGKPIGVSEDHYLVGWSLFQTGTLSIEGGPSVMRPPGYPVFVALTLWVADMVGAISGSLDVGVTRAVLSAQCLLLGCFALAIFATAATWCPLPIALAAGLTAGLHPYSLAMSTVISYHMLLLTAVAVSTYATVRAAASASPNKLFLLAGALWGVTALVKPVFLILPVFLGLWALAFHFFRRGVVIALLVALGVCAAVAPYIARNYAQTGKLLVTSQGGLALWASTVAKVPAERAFIDWGATWNEHGLPILSRVAGQEIDASMSSFHLLMRHSLALNDAFAAAALDNIKRQPGVYLHNVRSNFVHFLRDDMSSWSNQLLDANDRLSLTPWIDTTMRRLKLLALVGLAIGLLTMPRLTALLLVPLATVVVAHSLTFAYELYTYTMLPTVFLGLAMAAERTWWLFGLARGARETVRGAIKTHPHVGS